MNLLPCPVKPKPGEIFSSWVCAVALEHGLSLNAFCNYFFPKHIMCKRDIDKYADDGVWKFFADISGVEHQQVEKTVLKRKLKRVMDISDNMTNAPWITHSPNIYTVRNSYGNCYCPECLSSDKKPYLRLTWRLAFVTFCPEHRALLHDRCSKCDAQVSLYRLSPPNGRINLCHSCGYDLSCTPRKQYKISDDQMKVQNSFLSLMDFPKVIMPGGDAIPTDKFFIILHEIAYLCSKSKELAPAIERAVRMVYGKTGAVDPTRHEFLETYPPEKRFVFLNFAYWILHVWPCNFIFECIQRHQLDGRRTYPLQALPCERWCKSNNEFPFEGGCTNGIKQLQNVSSPDVIKARLGVRGIKPKVLKVNI